MAVFDVPGELLSALSGFEDKALVADLAFKFHVVDFAILDNFWSLFANSARTVMMESVAQKTFVVQADVSAFVVERSDEMKAKPVFGIHFFLASDTLFFAVILQAIRNNDRNWLAFERRAEIVPVFADFASFYVLIGRAVIDVVGHAPAVQLEVTFFADHTSI